MAQYKYLRLAPFLALLLMAAATLLLALPAEAGERQQEGERETSTRVQNEECQECHTTITHDYEASKHGQSNSLSFRRAWKKDGEPAECLVCHTGGDENVTGLPCDTCHTPMPGNHPEQLMPTPSEAETCGACHTDTFAEYEQSRHGVEGMACSNCHNPHTSSLKVENAQALCQDCHTDETHFFGFTSHAEQGLICSDCHLRVTGEEAVEAHSPRLHTFAVDLESCTQCHGNAMHFPTQGSKELDGTTPDAMQTTLRFPISERAEELAEAPSGASPITYILAAAAGIGVGFIVAPGVETLYRRIKHS
jgi:predicted CXXCH cytochrome family protein